MKRQIKKKIKLNYFQLKIKKLMIDEKNCYFFGRNKDTVDFVIDHASWSRVHAVLLWHKSLNRSFIVDLNSGIQMKIFIFILNYIFIILLVKHLAHGTFIGTIRLEPNKPQQVFIDSELKFGASTRTYIIRERPQMNKHFPSMLVNSANTNPNNNNTKNDTQNDSISRDDTDEYGNNFTSLPESEAELDVIN
jgi:hypothetical protein